MIYIAVRAWLGPLDKTRPDLTWSKHYFGPVYWAIMHPKHMPSPSNFWLIKVRIWASPDQVASLSANMVGLGGMRDILG